MEAMSLEEVMKSSFGKADQKAIFNNAGQAWNHILYWNQFHKAVRASRTGSWPS